MMILCRPGGSDTFFCANTLILLRTTSMPLRVSPWHVPVVGRVQLQHRLLVRVAQQGACKAVHARRLTNTGQALREFRTRTDTSRCGQLPFSSITRSRSMVGALPTTSSRRRGRYFSTLWSAAHAPRYVPGQLVALGRARRHGSTRRGGAPYLVEEELPRRNTYNRFSSARNTPPKRPSMMPTSTATPQIT